MTQVPPEIPVEILERELDAIAFAIEAAATQIANGRAIDLAPFGERVEQLCAKLVTLPANDAHRLGARLPDIVDTLDKIARQISDQHSTQAADSPASHQKASQAYGASLSRRRGGY